MKKRGVKGFTIVEIMVVAGIMAIIVAIAATAWMRARENARSRACQENLQKISESKEVYALENRLANGNPVNLTDLYKGDGTGYLKSEPYCPAGGKYNVQPIGSDPDCDYIVTMPGINPHKI